MPRTPLALQALHVQCVRDANEIPVEYFCSLDHNGVRTDIEQRPELRGGSVEYIAPAEYMVGPLLCRTQAHTHSLPPDGRHLDWGGNCAQVRPPMPPVFFFVIDVSVTAVNSGMVATAAAAIKSCLDRLPGAERTRVGFLTYDNHLHFYNLKSSLTQPQMMVRPSARARCCRTPGAEAEQRWIRGDGALLQVVSEIEDPFIPQPDDLIVNLHESRGVVDAFLDSLPNIFARNLSAESCTGPALQAAFMVMNPLGGKLLLFQSAVPSLGEPAAQVSLQASCSGRPGSCGGCRAWACICRGGKSQVQRQSRPVEYGPGAQDEGARGPLLEKVRSRVLPGPDRGGRLLFQVGKRAHSRGMSVTGGVESVLRRVWCSCEYTDLASIGSLPKYTCGQLYYFPSFAKEKDGVKLTHEIVHNLTRTTGAPRLLPPCYCWQGKAWRHAERAPNLTQHSCLAGWEAVMRIRCSKGLRISGFHGHFFIRSTDLLALPQVRASAWPPTRQAKSLLAATGT